MITSLNNMDIFTLLQDTKGPQNGSLFDKWCFCPCLGPMVTCTYLMVMNGVSASQLLFGTDGYLNLFNGDECCFCLSALVWDRWLLVLI